MPSLTDKTEAQAAFLRGDMMDDFLPEAEERERYAPPSAVGPLSIVTVSISVATLLVCTRTASCTNKPILTRGHWTCSCRKK